MLSTLRSRSVLRIFGRNFVSSTVPGLIQLSRRQFSKEAQPEQHTFKAETRRLLDIVANSLYTDKEVFVRELISNASDALEKLRFLQATHSVAVSSDHQLRITITVDEAAKTFTIQDSGVGMTKEDLISNLGTIARSGTREFSATNDSKLIGRFGVGFYSTFVVADRVDVYSRSSSSSSGSSGYHWSSDGHGAFTISGLDEGEVGTRIVLHLKPECADFARLETVRNIVNKFSAFVDFPIFVADAAAAAERVNGQEALWLKTQATEEQHVEFFRYLTGSGYAEPLYSLLYHTDAPLSIKAALYVVSEPPATLGGPTGGEEAGGVALYANRVLVQKEGKGVLPEWMRGWVRGVVDCEDSLSLNVSREHMQDSAAMKKLSNALVRKLLRHLNDEAKRDKDKFGEFSRKFGPFVKAGLLEDARTNKGANKDLISKLLRFRTVRGAENALVGLEEYVESLDEGMEILYVVAPDKKTAEKSPYIEGWEQEKFNALIFSEEIDEYLANYLGSFQGRVLRNVAAGEDADKKTAEISEEAKMRKDKLEKLVKVTLGDDLVDKVVFSTKLKSSPAVVTSQISPNMRKMMKQMMKDSAPSSSLLDGIPVTLELNPNHFLVDRIIQLINDDAESNDLAQVAVKQLFHNALIAAGLLDNPQLILADLNDLLARLLAQKTASP